MPGTPQTGGFLNPAEKAYRFTILIFVSLLTFGSYFAYDIIGAIAPSLVEELGAGRETVGTLYTMYSIAAILSVLIGGVLILPTRTMYRYLTDRVGNIAEVEPYFPLWGAVPITKGILAVVVIEHDAVSREVPRIPKGTDGRALQ